jgi:hypothetical protein
MALGSLRLAPRCWCSTPYTCALGALLLVTCLLIWSRTVFCKHLLRFALCAFEIDALVKWSCTSCTFALDVSVLRRVLGHSALCFCLRACSIEPTRCAGSAPYALAMVALSWSMFGCSWMLLCRLIRLHLSVKLRFDIVMVYAWSRACTES